MPFPGFLEELWDSLPYVELNPVRAGMVESAWGLAGLPGHLGKDMPQNGQTPGTCAVRRGWSHQITGVFSLAAGLTESTVETSPSGWVRDAL